MYVSSFSRRRNFIGVKYYCNTIADFRRFDKDSSWNAGELFSAPRNSVSDLLATGACNKYGVYLLLSVNMVYVGQSSDLAKRINQHVAKKEWWESVIILTTKDDSLNHCNVRHLPARLSPSDLFDRSSMGCCHPVPSTSSHDAGSHELVSSRVPGDRFPGSTNNDLSAPCREELLSCHTLA